jgi:hypothetical protein
LREFYGEADTLHRRFSTGRMVVDIVARTFRLRWPETLGRQIVVDNRGGANGHNRR